MGKKNGRPRAIEVRGKIEETSVILGNLRGKIMRRHVEAINKGLGRSSQVFGRTGSDIVMLMGDGGNIR